MVEVALHRVLRATGRIVPQTKEEVAQAEVGFDEESVELPTRLLTPPTCTRNDDAIRTLVTSVAMAERLQALENLLALDLMVK